MPSAELILKSDTKQRKQWFTDESFSHPAKMSLPLQQWIIENYTKPGETILDPMAGSGTILVACSAGRNVIAVELEQKFVDMMKGNWEKVRQRGVQLGSEMGECQIIQGDARQLEGLLVDKIVTSPPYTNRMDGGMRGSQAGMVPYTDETPDSWFTQRDQKNIGNLPYGQIDSIVASPPYEQSLTDGHKGKRTDGSTMGYTEVDSIVTSPPYEQTIGKQGGQTREDSKGFIGKSCAEARQYAHNDNNIGNLKGTSYLEAMLQVYRSCFAVLKPNGLMILVTKNFIRNKQEVRLDEDTIKLCEQAGFTFVERHYRKLTSQSFWRVIYHQRYPDAPEINREDILVLRK